MSPRVVGWAAAAALAAGAIALDRTEPEQRAPRSEPLPATARLLGPVRHLAADALWLRAEAARREGRHDLVLARGAAALALAPGAERGWDALASHQALVLGSVAREPDPARRRAWLEAGLATARAGEAAVADPAGLAFLRGILLQTHAENDPGTAWPDGVRGLWRAAAEAYERAAELGEPRAAGLAEGARASARSSAGR